MNAPRQPGGRFSTTHWSVVMAARGKPTPRSREALAALCEVYWYPLYAYLRRRGYQAEDAQDLTQGFFAEILERHALEVVDPERGKFRAFLLASLRHFVANERDRARAQKRGGGAVPISLDLEHAEGRYSLEPRDDETPETIFDRDWALALLNLALARLRTEFKNAGKEDLFDRLKTCLANEPGQSYSEMGASLEMSEGAVKVAVHRLRREFGRVLRDEIAQTVTMPEEIADEIRYLLTAIGSSWSV